MPHINDLGAYAPQQRATWQPYEHARLRWNGHPQVPRYMDGWTVTVIRCMRNSPYIVPLYRVSVHNWRGNALIN
jgi:hypothetical protein